MESGRGKPGVLSCPPARRAALTGTSISHSTYVTSYLSLLRTHETLGENRLKFAAQLTEMSEELTSLGKEVEKHRKTSKELGGRLERGLQEQEGLVDKVSLSLNEGEVQERNCADYRD